MKRTFDKWLDQNEERIIKFVLIGAVIAIGSIIAMGTIGVLCL